MTKLIKLIINNKKLEMSMEEIIKKYKESSFNTDDCINDEKVKLFVSSKDGLDAIIDEKNLTILLDYSRLTLDNTFTWMQKNGWRLD